jgi:ABC-2 type transport system permease protein
LVAYGALLFNALVFIYALVLIIATVSFWTTQSFGLARIFDNLLKVARYPLDIFEGFWRVIFIYFLPLILIAQIPSQALLQTLSLKFIIFSFSTSLIFLVIALSFWRIGLKNYLSASS